LFPGTEWKTEIAQIPQGATVSTSKGSALRFLELLRKKVTGARALSTPLGSRGMHSSLEELVQGFALEIYLDRHEEPWVVAPETFFKKPASPPPLSSPPAPPIPTSSPPQL
jgi:hypothetical protein